VVDLKSFLIGVVITAAVGGGIYSKYIKEGVKTVVPQVNAYALLGECVSLEGNIDIKKIESFLDKVEGVMPNIKKSDAVVTGVGIALGEDSKRPSGMGIPLRMCIKNISSNLVNLKEQAEQEASQS
jgi:hypothetical protein